MKRHRTLNTAMSPTSLSAVPRSRSGVSATPRGKKPETPIRRRDGVVRFLPSRRKTTRIKMPNDGLRITIDMRGGKFYWTITDLGFQYDSNRGYDSIVDAAHEAAQYHRQVKLGRHFRKQREARLAR